MSYKTDGGCTSDGSIRLKLSDYQSLRAELEALKAEKAELIWGLKDAKLFAVWVECLGRTDCEIYKHELEANANQSIERIDEFLDNEDGS